MPESVSERKALELREWMARATCAEAEVKRLREDNEGLRQFAEWCARIEGWRFQQVVDYAKRTLDA